MPFIIQTSDQSGNFTNPTQVGSFIIVGVTAGGGEATNTTYIPPSIGQIFDNAGNSFAANLGTSRSFQGSTDSAGITIASSWAVVTNPSTAVGATITPFPSGITQSAIFAYEFGGLKTHDVDTTANNSTGSFTTSFDNEFVYTLQGTCIPGGSFTSSYSRTAGQSSSYASGLAGGNDYYTYNVGPLGTYTLTVTNFTVGTAMAFRTNSTAVPNGVRANFAVHAPTGHGDANRSVTGVAANFAVHAPTPAVTAITTGESMASGFHNPTASGGANAFPAGLIIISRVNAPLAHSTDHGEFFNIRWVSS
jgi:hypothetical protein